MKATLCLALALISMVTAGSAPPPRKLIMTGWDSPDTAQFRRDLPTMEQWPFDGAIIRAQGRHGDGHQASKRETKGGFHSHSYDFDLFVLLISANQAFKYYQ